MSYVDEMLKIPYDQFDGISVTQVELLCARADKELEAKDKELAELKEILISIVDLGLI